MKLKNKQIPLRSLFCIAIGWLHCALIFAPIYTLLRHYVVGELMASDVIRSYLMGLLILVPVIISWFACRYLKNIGLYILVSAAGIYLTFLIYGRLVMIVPALFICFLRFYNRMLEERPPSFLDTPGYAGVALIFIPALISVTDPKLSSAFQYMSLIFGAIYFLLCFVHHGIERIDRYVNVNTDMRNMPSRRIVRISSAVLAALFLVFAVILLPALFATDINIRYSPPEREPTAVHEFETTQPEIENGEISNESLRDIYPEKQRHPIFEAIVQFFEIMVAIAIGIIAIIGLVYFILYLTRRFKSTFDDRGDLVENLQEDDLEAVQLKKPKSDAPGIFDRSPNAVVRRKYRKTILRASKIRPSAWMTPTEAEENAALTGQVDLLHALYAKARYSPEGCTKQDVTEL